MNKHKVQVFSQPNKSKQQQAQCDQLILWQQYAQKLSSIAGVYSDSYWASQSINMLKNQKDINIQSKTKQALHLMNGPNSKVDLMSKILKNLSQCRKIEQNQEHLVEKLIQTNQEWDKFKASQLAKLHLQQDFGLVNQGEDFPFQIDTFGVNFDNNKLQEFEKGYGFESKDVEI